MFTVDSFPGREFEGTVKQVRKAPTEISNVVTYTVVVAAENPDQSLLPGMTANVSVVVGEREDALRVPAAALRFQPATGADTASTGQGAGKSPGQGANRGKATERLIKRLKEKLQLTADQEKAIRDAFAEVGKKARALRDAGAAPDDIKAAVAKARQQARESAATALDPKQRELFWEMVKERRKRQTGRGRVWVVGKDGKAQAVNIITGISDGTMTEVVRGELQPGQSVIIGQIAQPKQAQRRWRFGL